MKAVFIFILAVELVVVSASPLFGFGGAGGNNNAAGGGGGLFGGGNTRPKSNGGATTQSPAAIQKAINGYASDVATVNKFIDQGMTSDTPGQLAQSAADAEDDEITQLKVLCPARQSDAPSAGAGEACNFLQSNTKPIVDMLQKVANVNQVQNPAGRATMRQTMRSINQVRCPMVLPRIQTLLNGSARQSSVNMTMVPIPAACATVNKQAGFFQA